MVFVSTLTLLSTVQFMTNTLPCDLAEDYLKNYEDLNESKLAAHILPYIREVQIVLWILRFIILIIALKWRGVTRAFFYVQILI